jgi:2-isopropylmalate synthase
MLPEPRAGERRLSATITFDGAERRIEGVGNGPIAAFVDALQHGCGIAVTFLDYSEHAVGGGADALAAAYVKVRGDRDEPLYGVGIDGNIITASLKAVASAANRVRKATADKAH